MVDGTDDLGVVFDALGNEHRREMVRQLALQPCSISVLADSRGLSLPAIHKHVRVLETAGLVTRRKVGRTNVLTLRRESLRRLRTWAEGFDPWWGTDDASLENYAHHLAQDPTTKEST